MSSYKKKPDFFATEEGERFMEALRAMTLDKAFNTNPCYCSDSEKYPDHLMPFVDKHVKYLRDHPATNPLQYLSNLRLSTRI